MILVNNPGSWAHIYNPLEHAPWHGLTPTDLVFPFFLFAVGNAMAFVMPRLIAGGDRVFWTKVLKRSAIIFAIGLFLNWWPFMRWQNNELVASGWTYTNAEGKLLGVRRIAEAKSILMRTRNVTEGQAYDLIREQAMNKRVTTEEIAGAIVNANEILSLGK